VPSAAPEGVVGAYRKRLTSSGLSIPCSRGALAEVNLSMPIEAKVCSDTGLQGGTRIHIDIRELPA
jgi:hypothetical protein